MIQRERGRTARLLIAATAIGIGGCATHSPKPLTAQLDPRLPLARHTVDPRRGLDGTDVAILAVVNNPDLKLAHDATGVAHVQAFAAGLLPDPQLRLTRDFPTNGGPTNVSAFNLGLGYDITSLLMHATTAAAAPGPRSGTCTPSCPSPAFCRAAPTTNSRVYTGSSRSPSRG